MKMSELKPGDKGLVLKVENTGEAARRLMDLGLHKGAAFKVVRRAPMGDPMEIKIRGSLLALRMKEAEFVVVEKETVPVTEKKNG